jgi:hypothetical protein
MSYLRYLCLFVHSGVHYVLCWVFISSLFCVPCVASFSGLSIFDCPFGNVYLRSVVPDCRVRYVTIRVLLL